MAVSLQRPQTVMRGRDDRGPCSRMYPPRPPAHCCARYQSCPRPRSRRAAAQTLSSRTESTLRLRTVWISDLHLGTPGCQAQALLDFLRHVECETLFLVGDIIDGWQLRRSWYWPQAHNDVVQKLLRKARKGTQVVFIPGNHDEFARRYVDHNFGGVDVADEWIHTTADGRRLWITHGDLFDGVIQCAKWLAHVGDSLYEFTLRLNRYLQFAARAARAAVLELVEVPEAEGQARGQLRERFRGSGRTRGTQARRARRRVRAHPPRRAARHRRHAVCERRRLGREPDGARRARRRAARNPRLELTCAARSAACIARRSDRAAGHAAGRAGGAAGRHERRRGTDEDRCSSPMHGCRKSTAS